MLYSVIPAAGLATRFLPASKAIPKEMFPVYGKPVIQYIVEEGVEAGFVHTIFVTAEGKESILDHFDRINPKFNLSTLQEDVHQAVCALEEIVDFVSVRQKYPRGLGHAVLTGARLIHNQPFAVLLPDMLLFQNKKTLSVMQRMREIFMEKNASVLALMQVPDYDRPRYGIVEGNNEEGVFRISRLIEKPKINETNSNLAIVGRYIFTPAIISFLQSQVPGTKGEIQLTDAINRLTETEPVYGVILEPETDLVFDAGEKTGFAMANTYMAVRKDPSCGKVVASFLGGD